MIQRSGSERRASGSEELRRKEPWLGSKRARRTEESRNREEALCGFQGAGKEHILSGGNGKRVPPVPIPNTEVKPLRAEGTWLDTARKTRSLPESISGDTMCLLFLLDWGQSFAARLGAALQRRGTSCSCARSARAKHDSGSGLQPLLAAYTPPLRMAQEGAGRPFLHPRGSVIC